MIGYVPQYKVAAELIYNALVDGTFEWARIADPEAGRVDDIQIAKPGRLDAYQVKWSETVQNVTFQNLIAEEKKGKAKAKPSLLRQLAEGWQRLNRLHSNHQVFVHLYLEMFHLLQPSFRLTTHHRRTPIFKHS